MSNRAPPVLFGCGSRGGSRPHPPAHGVDVCAVAVLLPDAHDAEPQYVGVAVPGSIALVGLHLHGSNTQQQQSAAEGSSSKQGSQGEDLSRRKSSSNPSHPGTQAQQPGGHVADQHCCGHSTSAHRNMPTQAADHTMQVTLWTAQHSPPAPHLLARGSIKVQQLVGAAAGLQHAAVCRPVHVADVAAVALAARDALVAVSAAQGKQGVTRKGGGFVKHLEAFGITFGKHIAKCGDHCKKEACEELVGSLWVRG